MDLLRIGALVVLGLVSTPCLAAAQSGHSDVVDPGVLDKILLKYRSIAEDWSDNLQESGRALFMVLAALGLAWTAASVVWRDADAPVLIAEVLKYLVMTGIFYFVYEKGPWLAHGLVKGVVETTAGAVGLDAGGSPSSLIDTGLTLFSKVRKQSWGWTDGVDVVVAYLLAIVTVILLAVVACNMVVLHICAHLIIHCGQIVLAFGGSPLGRDIVTNYFRSVLSIGMQIVGITVVAAVGASIVNEAASRIEADVALEEQLVLFLVALAIVVLANRVPVLFGGLASGMSAHHAVGGGASAAAASMAAGAAGAAIMKSPVGRQLAAALATGGVTGAAGVGTWMAAKAASSAMRGRLPDAAPAEPQGLAGMGTGGGKPGSAPSGESRGGGSLLGESGKRAHSGAAAAHPGSGPRGSSTGPSSRQGAEQAKGWSEGATQSGRAAESTGATAPTGGDRQQTPQDPSGAHNPEEERSLPPMHNDAIATGNGPVPGSISYESAHPGPGEDQREAAPELGAAAAAWNSAEVQPSGEPPSGEASGATGSAGRNQLAGALASTSSAATAHARPSTPNTEPLLAPATSSPVNSGPASLHPAPLTAPTSVSTASGEAVAPPPSPAPTASAPNVAPSKATSAKPPPLPSRRARSGGHAATPQGPPRGSPSPNHRGSTPRTGAGSLVDAADAAPDFDAAIREFVDKQ